MVTLSSSWQNVANASLSYGTLKIYARYTAQNTVNNTSTVNTLLRITATQWYSANTIKAGITGGSDYIYSNSVTPKQINAGDNDLIQGTYTVSHNANNGTAITKIYYWLSQTFGGSVASSNAPAMVEVSLPTIDRGGGAAGASKGTIVSTSATLTLTSNVNTSLGRYKFGSGSWTEFSTSGTDLNKTGGGSISKTFGSLSPNTSYTITVQFRRDYNQVWGSSASVTFTTSKPSTPSTGSIWASDVTSSSAKINWSGFSFASGASWGKYQYSFNGGSWTDCGQNTSVSFSSLSDNTTYSCKVRLIDNYGTSSNEISTSFTTYIGQATGYIKVNGEWKKGKLYYKVNGSWQKVRKAYTKVNGVWKESK